MSKLIRFDEDHFRLRRDEITFYLTCLVLGGLSAVWWMGNPEPMERFIVLFLVASVGGGIAIASLMFWVVSDD